MSSEVPTYDEFVPSADELPDDKAERIQVLVKRQIVMEEKLAQAESLTKKVRKELDSVRQQDLPNLLEELGMSSIVTADGTNVEIDTTIRASLGKTKDPEKAMRAIEWLKENGHPHLVKHVLSIPLTAGQDELAEAVLDRMHQVSAELNEQNEAWSIDVEDKTDVNANTLGKFVRDKLEQGETIPEDLFNVHRQRQTKIKL